MFLHDMESETKLTLIKFIHTWIWLFFNFVIFYMLYAAVVNKLDVWLWIGYGIIFLEGVTLLIFKSLLSGNRFGSEILKFNKKQF